ncbi:endolytic transglycosylase MltG [Streptomyces physcomitrii]|uniref:endolytic transglycosylase MltG n=1 Tax=Streptomyces physcomitrii TaxID=2724184 RepID=UPI0034111F5B
MTEYGRGPGPDPWHPDDPLYGDGYRGQQAEGQGPAYGDQSPQQYESWQHGAPDPAYGQDPYASGDPYGTGQYQQPYDTGTHGTHEGYGRQQYGTGQQPYDPGRHPQQSYDPGHQQPYDTGQHPQQPYGSGHYDTGQQPYGGGDPSYGGQQSYGTGQYESGWDGGAQAQGGQGGYGSGVPVDPYGGQDPYSGQDPYAGRDPRGGQDSYGGQDPYGGPGGQGGHPQGGAPGDPAGQGQQTRPQGAAPQEPQPGQGGRRPPQPEAASRPGADGPGSGWDPGPDQGEHAFFAGGDEDDEDFEEGRAGRRGRSARRGGGGGGGKKSRSGLSCMVATVLLAGVIGGGGYFGYQFYQDRFGPAPDYSGEGSGTVSVEIPAGASGYDIGQALKKKGIVKSVQAFVDAQGDNPDGQRIQHGFYTLREQMSGKSAVTLMLDPKSRNALIIGEGRRNTQIYAEIDKRLGIAGGTTQKVAKKEWRSLGLPKWAENAGKRKDPLEGFLYPASYPVDKSMKPADVLERMVKRADSEYAKYDLAAEAEELDLKDPLQLVTVASLVQAEGITHEDFRRMAAVVYNRLKPSNTVTNQKLEFDSTYNYLKNKSNIDIPTGEIRSYDDPYNTYFYRGLTPGPIGNPGEDALKAAIEPDSGGWMFFISIDCKTTTFSKTLKEHEKYVAEFNKARKEGKCE